MASSAALSAFATRESRRAASFFFSDEADGCFGEGESGRPSEFDDGFVYLLCLGRFGPRTDLVVLLLGWFAFGGDFLFELFGSTRVHALGFGDFVASSPLATALKLESWVAWCSSDAREAVFGLSVMADGFVGGADFLALPVVTGPLVLAVRGVVVAGDWRAEARSDVAFWDDNGFCRIAKNFDAACSFGLDGSDGAEFVVVVFFLMFGGCIVAS